MRIKPIELGPLFTLRSPYHKASYFYRLVVKNEWAVCHSFLSEQEATGWAGYYSKDDNRTNHFIHRHAQRVQHLVGAVTKGESILDAGCGFGSESILCGILGAQVTGVDLFTPQVNIAKKRLEFYESLLGREISTEFHKKSVFDVNDSFDVIWALESISHIDPADKFINFAYDHLNKGGKLIISDPNKLNPLIYQHTRRAQRKAGGPNVPFRNPQTGEMVPFAHERVFTVFSIKKLLLSNKFVIDSFHYSGLLPYLPLFNIGHKNTSIYLEKLMNPIWPKFLSGIYTVVALKV